jgi:hypothetical protein
LTDKIKRERDIYRHPVREMAARKSLDILRSRLTLLCGGSDAQLQSEHAHEMPVFWGHGTKDSVVR